jgi:hypothetical protein
MGSSPSRSRSCCGTTRIGSPGTILSVEDPWWDRCSLVELVEGVHALDYGRPSDRSITAMLREGRGTCSTKHLFLFDVPSEGFPDTEPGLVHRVYHLDRETARRTFGALAAEAIPAQGGLTDVHRYLTITVANHRVVVDATFPGTPWDGRSSMALACGPGTDHPFVEKLASKATTRSAVRPAAERLALPGVAGDMFAPRLVKDRAASRASLGSAVLDEPETVRYRPRRHR